MRNIKFVLCLVVLFCLQGVSTFAASFDTGPVGSSAWADTPAGKFECTLGDVEGNRGQLLKLGGKVIYNQPKDTTIMDIGGDTLLQGLYVGGPFAQSECPDIKANEAGYVIYKMPQYAIGMRGAAPSNYLMAYALINFNVMPPTYMELVEFDGRKDQNVIPKKKRITSDKKGFTIHYFGYPYGVFYYDGSGYDENGVKVPDAAYHIIFFDFATQKVTQIK